MTTETGNITNCTVQDYIPKKPHHPVNCKSPNRTFGQRKQCPVPSNLFCLAGGNGYTTTKQRILLTVEGVLVVFKQKGMSKHNANPSFVSYLFNDNNIGDMGIQQLERWSASQHAAVEVVVTLPSISRDLGEQLSIQHAAQRYCNVRYFSQEWIFYKSHQLLA